MSVRRRIEGFVHEPTFAWRELRDPDGPATPRQLARLNREGRLELVARGEAEVISKGQAAFAIDDAGEAPAGRRAT